MKKQYTEEQIIKAIKRHEAGVKVDEICRDLGISAETFYNCEASTVVSKSTTPNVSRR